MTDEVSYGANARLAALRDQRERLGLSLLDVAERTGIPLAHLEALEAQEISRIPSGPYLEAYCRRYAEAIGLQDDNAPIDPLEAEALANVRKPRVPFWALRILALTGAAVLLVWTGWAIWGGSPSSGVHTGQALQDGPASTALDQHLRMEVLRPGRFVVSVDGEVVLEESLVPGKLLEFRGSDRIEVVVPGAESVRLFFNGNPIIPQGRQDVPRRLVFLDDSETRSQ